MLLFLLITPLTAFVSTVRGGVAFYAEIIIIIINSSPPIYPPTDRLTDWMTLAAIKRCVEQRKERSGISPTTGVCKFRAIDAVSSSIQLFSVFISFSVPLLLGLSFYIFLLILFFSRSHNLHTCIRGGRRRWRRSWSRRVPLILSVISLYVLLLYVGIPRASYSSRDRQPASQRGHRV